MSRDSIGRSCSGWRDASGLVVGFMGLSGVPSSIAGDGTRTALSATIAMSAGFRLFHPLAGIGSWPGKTPALLPVEHKPGPTIDLPKPLCPVGPVVISGRPGLEIREGRRPHRLGRYAIASQRRAGITHTPLAVMQTFSP